MTWSELFIIYLSWNPCIQGEEYQVLFVFSQMLCYHSLNQSENATTVAFSSVRNSLLLTFKINATLLVLIPSVIQLKHHFLIAHSIYSWTHSSFIRPYQPITILFYTHHLSFLKWSRSFIWLLAYHLFLPPPPPPPHTKNKFWESRDLAFLLMIVSLVPGT